jgi:hypothetical protein
MSSRPPLPRGDEGDEPPPLREEGREFFEPPHAARNRANTQMTVRREASTHRR